ncbi:outer membrane protein assembly factor BamD [Salinarimonas soli]|uniref:Outer membrane protein assembly factor BamD n=1 Tax=Salinarimonas soli TaxID=1638099 RepID=A0A5B2VYM2_9HYPH|nr:outer membrane protein assembly factor BamD [Salinarimonas soli]KAA2244145.1 outer membrane protein assembly factor BamD [Salinarimonas soli]
MSIAKATLDGGTARAVLLLACGLALAGCDTLSSINPFDKSETYKMEIVAEVPAEQLYNDGLARMQRGDTDGAAKKFGEVEKQHPYSEWSRRAMIMTAFAHYQGLRYEDSINASRRYLQLHPASTDAAYAQYLLAMSHFNQIPDVTRDQDRSEKALAALQELVDRYPKSEYVADARQRIQVARDQIAGKEMEVGRYYLQRRNYTGAINRFRDVVAKYQTTRHVEEALARLTEAYMAMGIAGEAQTAAAVLGHNFPDSPWYKDSYALLQTGGLSPREDQGSWISRAFRGLTGVRTAGG